MCSRSYPLETNAYSISLDQHVGMHHRKGYCERTNKWYRGNHICGPVKFMTCFYCKGRHRICNKDAHFRTCVEGIEYKRMKLAMFVLEYLIKMSEYFEEKHMEKIVKISYKSFEFSYYIPDRLENALLNIFRKYTNDDTPKWFGDRHIFVEKKKKVFNSYLDFVNAIQEFRRKLNKKKGMYPVQMCNHEEDCKCQTYQMTAMERSPKMVKATWDLLSFNKF
jgi:hypothetical protein